MVVLVITLHGNGKVLCMFMEQGNPTLNIIILSRTLVLNILSVLTQLVLKLKLTNSLTPSGFVYVFT